jgi:hypothetical protein
MAFAINDFYSALKFGGARPSLFDVLITWPGKSLPNIQFMCKATSIPGVTMAAIPQPYFGRELKFAGNRTFDDWSTTIINDEDYAVRKGLEAWSEALNGFVSNRRASDRVTTSSYKGIGTVNHYGKTGNIIRTYEIIGLIPITIAPMPMDWSTDEIQSFEATFSVDYWKTKDTTRGTDTVLRQAIFSDQAPEE